MASCNLTGNYGSRKSIPSSLPYLTGWGVSHILEYWVHRNQIQNPDDEIFLLTGILLCGLWNEGNEYIIDDDFYDNSFECARDNPVECVRAYLEQNGIHRNRMGELIETSLESDFLRRDPPFYGYIRFERPNGLIVDEITEKELGDLSDVPLKRRQEEFSYVKNINMSIVGGLHESHTWYEILYTVFQDPLDSLERFLDSDDYLRVVDDFIPHLIEKREIENYRGDEIVMIVKIVDE